MTSPFCCPFCHHKLRYAFITNIKRGTILAELHCITCSNKVYACEDIRADLTDDMLLDIASRLMQEILEDNADILTYPEPEHNELEDTRCDICRGKNH